MAVELTQEAAGKILVAKLSGKLASHDYATLVPEVERLVQQYGKIRVLVQMHDFHGWTIGGLWEDIKFDLKHFRDIERLALVGESKWEAGMAAFCKPFTSASVRYFDISRLDEAKTYIAEGLTSSAS